MAASLRRVPSELVNREFVLAISARFHLASIQFQFRGRRTKSGEEGEHRGKAGRRNPDCGGHRERFELVVADAPLGCEARTERATPQYTRRPLALASPAGSVATRSSSGWTEPHHPRPLGVQVLVRGPPRADRLVRVRTKTDSRWVLRSCLLRPVIQSPLGYSPRTIARRARTRRQPGACDPKRQWGLRLDECSPLSSSVSRSSECGGWLAGHATYLRPSSSVLIRSTGN